MNTLNKTKFILITFLTLFFIGLCSTFYYYNIYIPELYNQHQSEKYFKKSGVTFGDSITWYDGKRFLKSHTQFPFKAVGYQEYVRQFFNCYIENKGESGYDMTQIYEVVVDYNKFKNIDFVILTSGANDARKAVTIGKIEAPGSSFDANTFVGALQSSIEHILMENPNIEIYLATPINGFFKEKNTRTVSGPYKQLDYISEEYAQAILALGRIYKIPVCDWYNTIQVDKDIRDLYGDNIEQPYYLHPTNKLYKKMGLELIRTMKL